MIDYNNLVIRRLIMHSIVAKERHQDSGTCITENELITLDQNVIELIRTRLIDASGKDSKAFDLELSTTGVDSFFGCCNDLHNRTDAEFIETSKIVGDLLASFQKKTNIPGGYLIFIEGYNAVNNRPVFIAIKAEPHEALQKTETSQLAILKVFLSPSQKLYKLGVIYERDDPQGDEVNDLHGCFLFDDQFKTESHPAEYFYKDFLGFSIGKNAKIQSARFYNKTESFIKENVEDYDQKRDLLSALRIEFTANQNATISPEDFARTYMPTDALRDEYSLDIAHELPPSIVKDDTLIKTKLRRKKIDFPNNIALIGPAEQFDDSVELIEDANNLEHLLSTTNTSYTIIKILGKPYQDE